MTVSILTNSDNKHFFLAVLFITNTDNEILRRDGDDDVNDDDDAKK